MEFSALVQSAKITMFNQKKFFFPEKFDNFTRLN